MAIFLGLTLACFLKVPYYTLLPGDRLNYQIHLHPHFVVSRVIVFGACSYPTRSKYVPIVLLGD